MALSSFQKPLLWLKALTMSRYSKICTTISCQWSKPSGVSSSSIISKEFPWQTLMAPAKIVNQFFVFKVDKSLYFRGPKDVQSSQLGDISSFSSWSFGIMKDNSNLRVSMIWVLARWFCPSAPRWRQFVVRWSGKIGVFHGRKLFSHPTFQAHLKTRFPTQPSSLRLASTRFCRSATRCPVRLLLSEPALLVKCGNCQWRIHCMGVSGCWSAYRAGTCAMSFCKFFLFSESTAWISLSLQERLKSGEIKTGKAVQRPFQVCRVDLKVVVGVFCRGVGVGVVRVFGQITGVPRFLQGKFSACPWKADVLVPEMPHKPATLYFLSAKEPRFTSGKQLLGRWVGSWISKICKLEWSNLRRRYFASSKRGWHVRVVCKNRNGGWHGQTRKIRRGRENWSTFWGGT